MGPPALERAAVDHSQEMATRDYMDHIGHDGSSPADRVTRAGYKWSAIGENLASGVMTADDFKAYRKAGADLVQACTGPMWNPYLAQEINAAL